MISERKQQILKVSKELFLHHGFKKVTLSDIAGEVGVSRPTVYQVFPNKEEIYKALIEQWQKDAFQRIEEAVNSASTIETRLRAAIEIWVIEPYQLIHSSSRAADFVDSTFDFAKPVMDAGYARFEGIVRGIFDDGEFQSKLNSEDAAHLMVVAMRGFKSEARDLKDLRQLIGSLMAVVIN